MTLLPTLGNFLSGIPVILFLSCLPALLSENWNRFRGPDGKGVLITEDFANSWTEKDYAWSCKLPGVGHSSPVLWGDKLFTTCASESTGEQFVLCLDAKSGKRLWQKTFLPRFTRTTNSTALHLQPHASTPSTPSYPGPPRNRTTSFAWTMMDLWLGAGISGISNPAWKRVFPDRGRRSRGRHPRP